MSITIRPTDNYAEYEFHSYKDVDRLLDLSYGGDMDIDTFEGVLVDNFIGYNPAFSALHTVRENHEDDIYTKKHSNQTKFDYLIVLETYQNSQSSVQRVIYTNDHQYINTIHDLLTEKSKK